MNRIFLSLVALGLAATASQAQLCHHCGGYTYHYRVHGHAVGGPPVGVAPQSFSVGTMQSAQSFSFVQPQAQSFSFVPQAQSFTLVPQAQSFSLVQTTATSQTLNQNSNTAGTNGTTADSQAVTPALLAALRIACNLVGSSSSTPTADVSALTAEVKAMRAELKALSDKLLKGPVDPKKDDKPTEPKKKLGQDPDTEGKKTDGSETPCEFKQLRLQAERLAAESAPKTEALVKVGK